MELKLDIKSLVCLIWHSYHKVDRPLFIPVAIVETIVVADGVVVIVEQICLKGLWL